MHFIIPRKKKKTDFFQRLLKKNVSLSSKMGFGNGRAKFDPAKETVAIGADEDEEISPEELALKPAPSLSSLPVIFNLNKMTFDQLHALFAMFKRVDDKEIGLDEVSYYC